MLAGLTRKLDLHVPENVPDCAKLEVTDVELKSVTASEDDRERVVLDMSVSCEWRWAHIKVEVIL